NAHILRELKSLIEFDHEPWAEHMRDMLLAANLAVDKARQAGARALPPDQLEALVERYWAAVRLGLAFHRDLPKLAAKANSRGRIKHRPGHNLLQRLKTFQAETLRFLTDFDVPFTNNLAEQDLRMMKVKMKNLRLVSNLRRRSNLRPPQIRHLDREKTPLQHPPNPHRKPGSDYPSPRRIATLGSYELSHPLNFRRCQFATSDRCLAPEILALRVLRRRILRHHHRLSGRVIPKAAFSFPCSHAEGPKSAEIGPFLK